MSERPLRPATSARELDAAAIAVICGTSIENAERFQPLRGLTTLLDKLRLEPMFPKARFHRSTALRTYDEDRMGIDGPKGRQQRYEYRPATDRVEALGIGQTRARAGAGRGDQGANLSHGNRDRRARATRGLSLSTAPARVAR